MFTVDYTPISNTLISVSELSGKLNKHALSKKWTIGIIIFYLLTF